MSPSSADAEPLKGPNTHPLPLESHLLSSFVPRRSSHMVSAFCAFCHAVGSIISFFILGTYARWLKLS